MEPYYASQLSTEPVDISEDGFILSASLAHRPIAGSICVIIRHAGLEYKKIVVSEKAVNPEYSGAIDYEAGAFLIRLNNRLPADVVATVDYEWDDTNLVRDN